MSKPKRIPIEDKNYFGWLYEEQTKIKHRVLSAYAKIWISKLGKYRDTMFFDCHAGCGAYIDKNTNEVTYGSSFLVEEVACAINEKRNRKNFICACETDIEHYSNFKKINDDIGKKTISLKNDDFEKVLYDPRVKRYYSTHPTLFFVDPFGYSMKMSSMKQMMENRKNEVFINFMFDWINRFLSVSSPELLDNFFGSNEWSKANNLSGTEREEFLIDLYKEELKRATKAKYVFAYRICFSDKNRTYYYLVHATNDIQGITYMKDSFASVNYGRVEYIGKNQDGITLFDLASFKSADFAERFLKVFKAQSRSFDYVWAKVADIVPYTCKDLSEALEMLQQEGKVTITRVSSKRGQYKGHDLIKFGDNI